MQKSPFNRLKWLVTALSVLYSMSSSPAQADIFGTEKYTPQTQGTPIVGCPAGPVSSPLQLIDAITLALCHNPKTKEAWAQIEEQAAGVGTAKGAYMPTLTANSQEITEKSKTTVPHSSDFNSTNTSNSYSAGITLSWVLYDFGGRAAALDKAEQLVVAAQANHMITLQSVFIATAKDYYLAQATAAALSAARESEDNARLSLKVAMEKEAHGAASVGDELQARTAWLQAQTRRVQAEGDNENAAGALASDLAERPDTRLYLPDVDDGVKPDRNFSRGITALINDAADHHPGIRSAEAQLHAAEANVRQTQSEGLPTISLTGKSNWDNQRVSEGLGQPYMSAQHSDNYLGVQVTVPLFEGFTRQYKIHAAEAQVEEKQQSLEDTRNTVELDVWKSYQSMRSNTASLLVVADLLISARKSWEAAEFRYEKGVGSLLEVLNAQTALAEAQRQHIRSLTDWRYSRLELAQKIGLLDTTNLQD